MKRVYKLTLIPLLGIILAACGTTRELYEDGRFNSANFDYNYYTDWNHVDEITPNKTFTYKVTPVVSDTPYINVDPTNKTRIAGLREEDQMYNDTLLDWNIDYPTEDFGKGYGPTKNLTTIDNSFAYGYLSKLYDGRVRCDGFYTRSRVQLDASGYGTFFPKALTSYKYFAFTARGGTGKQYENVLNIDIKINYHLSFYVRNSETRSYVRYNFNMNNVPLQTNNGGRTSINLFYFEDVLGENWDKALVNTVAMSLTFDIASNPYDDLVADRNSGKCHFALMLYEVMLPDSTWY